MRAALLSILILAAVALAGCQTQPHASGHAQADALMAELQAESTTTGVAATAISMAGSADPSGMGAGAAHTMTGQIIGTMAGVGAELQMANEIAAEICAAIAVPRSARRGGPLPVYTIRTDDGKILSVPIHGHWTGQ